MKLKIKNYKWNGYGFPVIFDSLPAVKLRGELVPDVDFNQFAKPLIEYMCTRHEYVPFSGNQIKFIRTYFGMTLREFAEFMGVTHVSVMRWEKNAKASAKVGAHIEFVMKIKVLRRLQSDAIAIDEAVENIEEVENVKTSSYKIPKPFRIPEKVIQAAL